MKIKKLFGGVNVQPMLWALQANPRLWNADNERTADSASPHREVDDIWVRYMAKPLHNRAHESVWYPAADLLPVRDLAFALMADVRGERLGGILITRIKAGKQCYPHDDRGGWHAEYYRKFAIQIQSAPGQYFCFENERLEPMPGDVYEFDNQYTHWVENPTAHDRTTMIVCIKT